MRTPDTLSIHDLVIVGGGGHSPPTPHDLAASHGITDVAVIGAAWIGGSNTARNTAIVLSVYLLNSGFRAMNFELGLRADPARALDFNLMYELRGFADQEYSDDEPERFILRACAMRQHGTDTVILTGDALRARVPELGLAGEKRVPIIGALVLNRRGCPP